MTKQLKYRIGIATTVLPDRRSGGGTGARRPILHFCRIARRAAESNASVMLFDPSDVDWRSGTVEAWVPEDPWRPLGKWERNSCPLPDVIYENVFVHLAVRGFSTGLRRHARERGLAVFNPPMLNKWQMGRWLASSELKGYIPATVGLRDIPDAIARIRSWGEAYVKPVGGYGGMGVTRVQVMENGLYRVSVDRQKKDGKKQRLRMSEQALATLLRRMSQKPHILQQGIHLLTLGNRKVDFRVVVHRDGLGDWKLVGIVPKLAVADGVVTNIIAGGQRLSLTQCQSLADRHGKTIPVRNLEECALRIAERITRNSPFVGLLGFDLGVDHEGKIWMIEVNPKPARSLLSEEMKHQAARYTADYAVYLARRGKRA